MPILMFKPVPIDGESMLKFRYLLEFPTESGIESYYVRALNKPKFPEYPKVNIPYMSFNYVLPWKPLEIDFIDSLKHNNTKFLEWINFFKQEHYDNFAYARAFKKNIVIKALDPVGVVVEKWTLVKCYLDTRENFIPNFEHLKLTLHFDRSFIEELD